jgi:hypothetical protein
MEKAGVRREKLEEEWTGVGHRVLYAHITRLLVRWAEVKLSDSLMGLC